MRSHNSLRNYFEILYSLHFEENYFSTLLKIYILNYIFFSTSYSFSIYSLSHFTKNIILKKFNNLSCMLINYLRN